MNENIINANNSELTGGKWINFERKVQSAFSIMMLFGSQFKLVFGKREESATINEIYVQTYYLGYKTDDMLVVLSNERHEKIRFVCQVKSSVKFNQNKEFKEMLEKAWADYANPNKFTQGKDKIVFITGLLNETDTKDTRRILELAHKSADYENFRFQLASKEKQDKVDIIFNAFPENIKDNEEKFRFLKHLVLYTYDLDIEGTVLPIIYSVLSRLFPNGSPQVVWDSICNFWAEQNSRAGGTNREIFFEYLNYRFKVGKEREEYLRENIEDMSIQKTEEKRQTLQYEFSQFLLKLFLINSWAENNNADQNIVAKFFKADYEQIKGKLRNFLDDETYPIMYSPRQYFALKEPLGIWETVASKIIESDLDEFKQMFCEVFKADKHFHSPTIRKGLATSLAIFANNHDDASQVDKIRRQNFASECLYDIFAWNELVDWERISDVLKLFSEASPEFLLERLEKSIDDDSDMLNETFRARNISFQSNTVRELIRSLEMLAHEPQYLNKSIAILGKIALKFSEFDNNNDFISALTRVYLPWNPHTMASLEQQVRSINILFNETPDVCLKMLFMLLPNKITHSIKIEPASWRKVVPIGFDERKVLMSDYIEAENKICELILKYSKGNKDAVIEIADNIANFMLEVLDEAIAFLANEFDDMNEGAKLKIWHMLDETVAKHKYFANAEWAVNEEQLDKLTVLKDLYAPNDLIETSLRLFGYESYLYDGVYGEIKLSEQRENLDIKRSEKIKQIFDEYGINGIIKLTAKSKNVYTICQSVLDAEIVLSGKEIQNMLVSEDNSVRNLIYIYLRANATQNGIEWAKKINIKKWRKEEKVGLFCALPFLNVYWQWAEDELKDAYYEYWRTVNPAVFDTDENYNYAVKKLLKFDNINVAIEYLYNILYAKKVVDVSLTVSALNKAYKKGDFYNYHVAELLKYLQSCTELDFEILAQLEFQIVNLLKYHEIVPKTLFRKIATQPDYFLELIKKSYRFAPYTKISRAESDKANSTLFKWDIVPGFNENGEFIDEEFHFWIKTVRERLDIDGISDYIDLAIGKVLIYAPKDQNGLPIVPVAKLIENNETIKAAFRTSLFNSRGAHLVSAEAEIELANKYRSLSDAALDAGYRKLSEMYLWFEKNHLEEAERIKAGK